MKMSKSMQMADKQISDRVDEQTRIKSRVRPIMRLYSGTQKPKLVSDGFLRWKRICPDCGGNIKYSNCKDYEPMTLGWWHTRYHLWECVDCNYALGYRDEF